MDGGETLERVEAVDAARQVFRERFQSLLDGIGAADPAGSGDPLIQEHIPEKDDRVIPHHLIDDESVTERRREAVWATAVLVFQDVTVAGKWVLH